MNYFSIVINQLVMFIIYASIGAGAVKIHLYDHGDLDVFCKYIVKPELFME